MSKQEFNDQVAIVTGAGTGIGYEICRQLALQGATVVLNDIDPAIAEKATARIKEEGGNCTAVAGDVGDAAFTSLIAEQTMKLFGKINIAIANAGITLFSDFFDYTPESFYKVLQVNMGGTFFLTQAVAKYMKEQKEGGSILYTSSVVGHQAHKNLAAYAMTKAGIEMLAKNLVIELAQYNINVNAVAPGATLTERTMEDGEYEKKWSQFSPTGRPSTAKDIAEAALFLVSSRARQINGQTIIIDGGWSTISPSPF